MREMLEPIFGESGAVVAQFLITLVVVLVLVGVVYWLVRQFTGIRLHGAGRNRGPRLAIIDALSIDSRRKLVLIRRDHIEHLILIGGPSDLVVEPSIVRGVPAGSRQRPAQQQRPQAQQATAATPVESASQPSPVAAPQPQARRDEATGASEPIPFPQPRRAQMRHAAAEVEPTQRRPQAAASSATLAAGAPSARFEETSHPTRIDSVFSLANAIDDITDKPVPEEEAADFVRQMDSGAHSPSARAEYNEDADAPELSDDAAPAFAIDESESESDGSPSEDAQGSAQVHDLEEEMARLLGEITSKRDS